MGVSILSTWSCYIWNKPLFKSYIIFGSHFAFTIDSSGTKHNAHNALLLNKKILFESYLCKVYLQGFCIKYKLNVRNSQQNFWTFYQKCSQKHFYI